MGFGRSLKRLRMERGWRQEDLVAALGHQFARSTLANVETGRERPSSRLWIHISEHLPEWVPQLRTDYEAARARTGDGRITRPSRGRVAHRGVHLAGPFRIEALKLVYTFRYSRAPEEIIEVRRVKALRAGADGYGLKFSTSRTGDFSVDEEALWGGSLVTSEVSSTADEVHHLRTFDFGRTLRRGETHDFAVRSWVERDTDPDTEIVFTVTLPTDVATIHVNFTGPDKPRAVWEFGPVAGGSLQELDGAPLSMSEAGAVRFDVEDPVPGAHYGVRWCW